MSSTQKIMYGNALADLYAGRVSDLDREILAYSPMPSEVVDPYAAQEADALTTMQLTGEAMKVWMEEAKKAHYFSKHFVTLSKMIMNGTAVMARGLVTLHERGEDPAQAPMSIGDLISLSSYHFRKSYVGVIQTAKKHPEISERLLINQLGWCNTLMRLFRTKEKLASKAEVRGGSTEGTALPASGAAALEAADGRGLEELKPLSAPAAYGAPRAFGAYRRKQAGNAGSAALPEVQDMPAVPAGDPAESSAESADPAAAAECPEGTPEQPEGSAPAKAAAALPEGSGAFPDPGIDPAESLVSVLSRLFRPPD